MELIGCKNDYKLNNLIHYLVYDVNYVLGLNPRKVYLSVSDIPFFSLLCFSRQKDSYLSYCLFIWFLFMHNEIPFSQMR